MIRVYALAPSQHPFQESQPISYRQQGRQQHTLMGCMCTALHCWQANLNTIFFVVLACRAKCKPYCMYVWTSCVVLGHPDAKRGPLSTRRCIVPSYERQALSDHQIQPAFGRNASFLLHRSSCHDSDALHLQALLAEKCTPCAYRLALPVLYWVTLCKVCFLQFLSLQKALLVFGTFTCANRHRAEERTCYEYQKTAAQSRTILESGGRARTSHTDRGKDQALGGFCVNRVAGLKKRVFGN